MSNRSAVRRFGQYYEVSSQFSVEKDLAYDVTRTAMTTISRFVGPVALAKQKGLRIMSPNPTLDLKKLSVSFPDRHNILVTSRRLGGVDTARFQGAMVVGLCGSGGEWPRTSSTVVLTAGLEVNHERNATAMVESAIHEFAHSFDIGHCALRSCIMTEATDITRTGQFVSLRNPFCDNHAEQLELAGYKALAETV